MRGLSVIVKKANYVTGSRMQTLRDQYKLVTFTCRFADEVFPTSKAFPMVSEHGSSFIEVKIQAE